MTYLLQGDFTLLTWRCSRCYGLIGWSCRWNNVNWEITKIIIICKDKSIGDNSIVSTLPWGSAVLVCVGGTTDDMLRSAGSAVCSGTSTAASCGWGADRGGDGTCCVWISSDEGDDSTSIGDAGWGGGDGAILWRFGCDLVLLGPFLLTWLDSGVSELVWAPLVFADLPVCCCNNQDFINENVKEYWWNFVEK